MLPRHAPRFPDKFAFLMGASVAIVSRHGLIQLMIIPMHHAAASLATNAVPCGRNAI